MSVGLAILLASVAAVIPNDSLAQSCSPRPNVRVSVSRVADGRLTVTVVAGAGPISSVHFPGATASVPGTPPYLVVSDGQARTLPYTLVPASPSAGQVTFDIQRTGGSSVTVPIVVQDACGPWQTFVGGGGPFLDPPPPPRLTWTPGSISLAVAPGTIVTRMATVATTASLSGATVAISPSLTSVVSVAAPQISTLATGPGEMIALSVSVPASASPGVVRGELSILQSGSPLGAPLPIEVTVLQPSAATVPDGLTNPTLDRVVFPPDESPYVRDQVLVEVTAGTNAARVDQIAASVGAVVVGKESELNWYHFRLGSSSPPLTVAIVQLRLVGDVRMAVRSVLASTRDVPRTPNDPRFDSAWSEAAPGGNNWGHELVQLPSAWSRVTGSRDVRIGVVDTGFQRGHEDLVGNVDTIRGETPVPLLAQQWRHGTQVAGIIGARGNNGTGLAGVTWDTTMILHGVDLAFSESGVRERYAASILRAVLDGAVIVNISLGSKHATKEQAFEEAEPYRRVINILRNDRGKDFLLVAASHNESVDDLLSMPSGLAGYKEFPNVVSVTSVQRCEGAQCQTPLRFTESGQGPSITVAAPGQFIPTTTAECSAQTGFVLLCPNDQYLNTATGTSIAAPFVSGVAGLVLDLDRQLRQQQPALPQLTAEKLRKAVLAGAMAGNRWVCRYPLDVTPDTCGPKQGIPVLNAPQSLKALERLRRWDTGSVAPGGAPAIPGPPIPPVNYVAGSGSPMLSADGRYLAFETHSLNLAPETADRTDIGSSVLVKDLQTGALEWVSDPAHGNPPAAASSARSPAATDLQASATTRVYAVSPSMSADGRYVAFVEYTGTSASNKTTNIVVHDRETRTYQVFAQGSLSIGGGQLDGTSNPYPPLVISGDGSTIVFKIAPDAASGLFFGDLVSLNRTSRLRVSIADTVVLRERPLIGCTSPPPNNCTEAVPLRQAEPELMGRGVSFDGRRVLVRACCYHVYQIDQRVATRLDPEPPTPDPTTDPFYPSVTVGLIDMSSDGRFVAFTQKVTPFGDPGTYTSTMYWKDLSSAGIRTLTSMNETSNVSWNGPFALSGDGQRMFHQLRGRSGAPLADHPTIRQPMVARDTSSGGLVQDAATGKTEIVTAAVDGVALRCGIQDITLRLVTNSDGRVLAYADRDYAATNEVVPWDRNQLRDVYVVDRSAPIRAPIHIESPCTDFDLGPIIPNPH